MDFEVHEKDQMLQKHSRFLYSEKVRAFYVWNYTKESESFYLHYSIHKL